MKKRRRKKLRQGINVVGQPSTSVVGSSDEPRINNLMQLHGMSEELATELYTSGFRSVAMVAEAEVNKLTQVKGIGKKSAPKIIKSAQDMIQSKEEEEEEKENKEDEDNSGDLIKKLGIENEIDFNDETTSDDEIFDTT